MAGLRSTFAGIKSPNPVWLASAPPNGKAHNVTRAFKAGWGGVVWQTLGEEGPPVVNGPRHGGRGRLMIARPAVLALAAALATPALAAPHFEHKGYMETVPAGSAIERELGCAEGTIVAGGYTLDNVARDKGPFSKITPIADAPVPGEAHGTIVWRVGFFNDYDTDLLIDFRISLICD